MNSSQSKVEPLRLSSETSRDVLDTQFRQIEQQADLLRFKLDGWCVWPVIQYSLFYHHFAHFPLNPITEQNRFSLSERVSFALRDYHRLLMLPQSPYVVLVQSSNRSESVGSLYKDIYFDDLLKELGACFKIENLVHRRYLDRMNAAFIPSQMTTTGINFLIGGFMKLGIPANIKKIAADLSQCILFNYKLDFYTPRRVELSLTNFYWSRRIYRAILKRIRPQYLLLTTSTSYASLVAAAKDLGIRVVEFQHGQFNRHHAAYSWTKYALPYKSCMPIPDNFFVYGDYWKKELTANGFWGDEVHSVGSLRIDQYRQLERKMSNRFTILLTTQNIDTKNLVEFLKEFLDIAKGKVDFRLIIKLHPSEVTKDYYQTLLSLHNENVTILYGSEPPSTFELLKQSDLHLSIYSTCHYEALSLGVPTGILPLLNHEMMMDLVQDGSASLIHSPAELVNLMLSNHFQPVASEVSNKFFALHAVENMLTELKRGR